jgi:putative oxidoreductase
MNKTVLADTGLLIVRVGLGLSFIFLHGLQKLTGGPERWAGLGKTMSNLGIDFMPVFWGFMAAFAETFGAVFLILGLFYRPATFMLAFTMFVAMMTHLAKLDPWNKVGYPMELMFVFIGLLLIGPGRFSLDNILFGKKIKSQSTT